MMFYSIYDCYEGETIHIGNALGEKEAEEIMANYFEETDYEANLYAIREDGKVFVLGDHDILEEVKQ